MKLESWGMDESDYSFWALNPFFFFFVAVNDLHTFSRAKNAQRIWLINGQLKRSGVSKLAM